MDQIKNQSGATTIVIIMLVISALIALSSVLMVSSISEQKLSSDSSHSLRALYAAESGMEDALLRFKKGWTVPSSYQLAVGGASSTITDLGIFGGARTVTSAGESADRVRKIAITYELTQSDVGFHYGAQAGEGGITIDNNCSIDGNVYSNGPIDGQGSHNITGTVIIAKNGNYLDDANVDGDAYVHTCQNGSVIQGELQAVNFGNCTAVGGTSTLFSEIATTALPITEDMITEWKNDAAMGGTHSGNYIFAAAGQTRTIGPKKIVGNLEITKNNCILYLTGTVWVTGNITIKSSTIRLASSYGGTSGMLIADGKIDLQTTSAVVGSGVSGSYLLLISTDNGTAANPAISIGQSFTGDILFTNRGWIKVNNSTNIREITGYGIALANQAGLTYEVGIANASFSSGPGATWTITSWREIQ